MLDEQAMQGHHMGCTVSSFDGFNAFNSVTRARMLPAQAKYLPSVT